MRMFKKIASPQKTFPRQIFAVGFLLSIFLFSLNAQAEGAAEGVQKSCTLPGGTAGDRTASVRYWEDDPTTAEVEGDGSDFIDNAMFEMDNPVCLAIMVTGYAPVKLAIANMNRVCGSGSAVPRVYPSLIEDSIDVAKATRKAGTNPSCKATIAAAGATLSIFLAEMSVTFGVANGVYRYAHLCGSEWTQWNATSMLRDKGNRKAELEEWIKSAPASSLNFDNKNYREWYYGGVERADNSSSYCRDVTKALAKDAPPQIYYFRGTQTANYNCEKYDPDRVKKDPLNNNLPLTEARRAEYDEAFKCCIDRSRSSACIEYEMPDSDVQNLSDNYTLCRAGTRCSLNGITFSAGYEYDERLICVRSYSLCPYNFNLEGGSTICDYYKDAKKVGDLWKTIQPEVVESGDCSNGESEVRNSDCSFNSKAGKCRNYCQQLNHCVVTGSYYQYKSSIDSPYFSQACIDFTGDSKNSTSYDTGIFSGKQKQFSAPIAQCFKETLENVFFNKAGHSVCRNAGELPDRNGNCSTDSYVYRIGDQVTDISFFARLQNNLKAIVKMALTIAVIVAGFKILAGQMQNVLNKKDLIMIAVKFSLVLYFATGTAWQDVFFDVVYNASSIISKSMVQVSVSSDEKQRDGCQFGTIYETGERTPIQATTAYPYGKDYLAIWDALDCKIARYLGLGPTATQANIAKLILAGLLTGAVGIYFAVALLVFGVYLIILTLRALHIFLISSFMIILMVYVSPIVIPMVLFEKTKGFYKKWLDNLIGFILQPIILFAYIGLCLIIFDKVMVGSATFDGPAPNKSINCDKICYDNLGHLVTQLNVNGTVVTDPKQIMANCDSSRGMKVIDPSSDSVACMIDFKFIKQWPGLEFFGISIPMLSDVFTESGRDKIITMLSAAIIMYILAYFIAEIPGIASGLMGGTALPAAQIPGVRKTLEGISGMK